MTNKKNQTTHQTIKCDTAFKHYIEIVLITTIFNMDAFIYGKHNGVKKSKVLIRLY